MFWRGQTGYGPLQRGLAFAGLLLMAACFVWLQLLPPAERTAFTSTARSDRGGPVRLVIIDAGHGGQDSGAIRDGVLEKDLTLDVARRLEQLLRATGLRTVLTRSGDESVSLAERAALANEQRDCVFVSIHFDEGGRAAATGVNTYYAARQAPKSGIPSWVPFLEAASEAATNPDSQSLAGFVQQALVTRTGAVDRGIRTQQFYVIANVRHPAVLVEGGFLTNQDDLGRLKREDYRQELAAAISDGINEYRSIVRQRGTVAAVQEPST